MVARERDLRTVNNKVCYLIEWQKMSVKPSSSEKPWLLPSICCSNRAGEFSFVSEPWDSKKGIQFLAALSEHKDLRGKMSTSTGRTGTGLLELGITTKRGWDWCLMV